MFSNKSMKLLGLRMDADCLEPTGDLAAIFKALSDDDPYTLHKLREQLAKDKIAHWYKYDKKLKELDKELRRKKDE